MKERSGLLSAITIALIIGCVTPAYSQGGASFAQLNGTVQDTNGAAIAKGVITLRNLDTNQAYTTTSNDAGFYIVPNLPPGRYELAVTSTGFGKYTQTGIALTVGQTATVNVTLKVTVEESISVTSETPPIEPTRTEVSQVIETRQIATLPVSGRLFTDFALLTPGVATGRTSLGTTVTEFDHRGRRGLHQRQYRRAARHAASGVGAGIPRRQQQFRVRIRAGDGRHCQRGHQVGRQ
jgi:hypothetical protein